MISERFSTNPAGFNKFGRGRRIDLANSDGMTQNLSLYFMNLTYSYVMHKIRCFTEESLPALVYFRLHFASDLVTEYVCFFYF